MRLSFIKQYFTKPRTVGAILPSSKYLAEKMVKNINFDDARCIVEYGPGTGVFTDKMLKARRRDTFVLLIERNLEFYNLLREKYKNEPNMRVINDSAENIGKHLAEHEIQSVDYIISGLPFASLPRSVSSGIMLQTKKHLKQGGSFITFQYTLVKKDFFMRFFSKIDIEREIRNIPPAYVLTCRG